MKSTKEDKEKEESKYPKMGITHTDMVVLFWSETQGVVIHSGQSARYVGEYFDEWIMSGFTDYHGKIILEN